MLRAAARACRNSSDPLLRPTRLRSPRRPRRDRHERRSLRLRAEGRRKSILVDCGLSFAGPEAPGVDIVLPDLRYIIEERANLLGIVITHAHEDHIGALAALWPSLRAPVYCTRFAAGLLATRRLSEPGAPNVEINVVPQGGAITLGPFDIEFVPVAHSIPESNALAIRTPAGLVVHTGDWKIDPTRASACRPTRSACASSARRACWHWSATRPTSCATARARARPMSPPR